MSCISYVRSCVILKGLRYSDIYFERERYTAINYFENCAFYCQQEVDELYSDAFLGVIDGLVTVFDGECYFYSCSKCILKAQDTRYVLNLETVDTANIFRKYILISTRGPSKKYGQNIFFTCGTFAEPV